MRQTIYLVVLLSCCATIGLAQSTQQIPTLVTQQEQDVVYGENEVDVKATRKNDAKVKDGSIVKTKRSDGTFLPFTSDCPVKGTATVRITINKAGKVTDSTLLKGSGCIRFDKKIAEDARKQKYTPALKGGQPVSQRSEIEFTYFWPRGKS